MSWLECVRAAIARAMPGRWPAFAIEAAMMLDEVDFLGALSVDRAERGLDMLVEAV